MKPNRFMLIMSIITFLVILVGSTFAYFNVSASSGEGAVGMEAAIFDIRLDILPLYTGKPLIPTNDSDISAAYNNNCVDMYDRGACSAYTMTVENHGTKTVYSGTINFTLQDITNFKYRLLDEDGNVYQDTTTVITGTDQSLGNSFTLDKDESKEFTLIVWLPNMSYEQDNTDSNGHFNANVTYFASVGTQVTGTFSA